MKMITSNLENRISKDKNILIVLNESEDNTAELQYLMDHFCGQVIKNLSEIKHIQNEIKVYVCGDFSNVKNLDQEFYIIKEFSSNYENFLNQKTQCILLGEVPIIIGNSGVYFRKFFSENDYFNKIKSEHEFQQLTESTKHSKAFRTGIYLTQVLKENHHNTEVLNFHLLRCSSNFTGPTDNFRATDHVILNKLNECVKYVFEKEIKLNHVLAQIYENTQKSEQSQKEIKAKIKAHSDKTKDMPKEGLIVFCTFYDRTDFPELTPSETDPFDFCYKHITGLSKLHFKLKSTVHNENLAKEFTVTLYPNSVFLIPLSTNRQYTHEIKTSMLNVEKIPVRMGYVVRCSNVEAQFINNETFIKEHGQFIKLQPMTSESIQNLKNSYVEENKTENLVEYGKVHFSMNLGDYEKPIF